VRTFWLNLYLHSTCLYRDPLSCGVAVRCAAQDGETGGVGTLMYDCSIWSGPLDAAGAL
jgi:hypothetical protein